MRHGKRLLTLGGVAVIALTGSVLSAQELALSREQMGEFLRTAEVVDSERTSKGLTRPWRLTLSDGQMTHDALFQSVDQRGEATIRGGGTELHFVDSFAYNIAAYRLAGLVGLSDMIPVTVERRWRGERGAVTWWVDDVKFDEAERQDLGVTAPDAWSWNQQIYRLLVFSALVQDSDRTLENNLITDEWKLWMIDFTRAFRIGPELENPDGLRFCERDLLVKLIALKKEQLEEVAADYLTALEIDAVMTRRDRLVAHFQKLIAEHGMDRVLY